MRSKITRNGQITIPKTVRSALRLGAGDMVQVELAANRKSIVLRPMKVRYIDPDQAYYWEESWQKMEQSADRDIRAGRVRKIRSPDELDD